MIFRHGEPGICTAACVAEKFTPILAGSFGGPLLACRRDHGGVAAIRQLTCRTAAGGTAKTRPLHGPGVHREIHIGQSGVDRPGYRLRQQPQPR